MEATSEGNVYLKHRHLLLLQKRAICAYDDRRLWLSAYMALAECVYGSGQVCVSLMGEGSGQVLVL